MRDFGLQQETSAKKAERYRAELRSALIDLISILGASTGKTARAGEDSYVMEASSAAIHWDVTGPANIG